MGIVRKGGGGNNKLGKMVVNENGRGKRIGKEEILKKLVIKKRGEKEEKNMVNKIGGKKIRVFERNGRVEEDDRSMRNIEIKDGGGEKRKIRIRKRKKLRRGGKVEKNNVENEEKIIGVDGKKKEKGKIVEGEIIEMEIRKIIEDDRLKGFKG